MGNRQFPCIFGCSAAVDFPASLHWVSGRTVVPRPEGKRVLRLLRCDALSTRDVRAEAAIVMCV